MEGDWREALKEKVEEIRQRDPEFRYEIHDLMTVLPVQTNRTSVALASVTVTNTATDSDIPLNILSYQLVSGPTNAC